MDIVFLGTAPYGFPVMEDLARRDDTNVKAVITQPDRKRGRGREPQSPPVANYARDLGLPLYQPEDINEEGPTLFDDLGTVDLAVVIAYGQILSQELLEEAEFKFYNFHASLLPRWRGAAPIRHTLLAGDDETGVTVFRIQPDLDAGPICVQLQIDVRERENYGSLYERLSQMNVGALRVFLADLEADRLQCKPQEGESTYAPKITSDDARIPWDRPASELENFVLAYNPDTAGGERIAAAGPDRWYEPLVAGSVDLGRTDPDQDPLGYRALFALELAARYYDDAPALHRKIPEREQVYPETALISQFETGSIDAALAYRNMAVERGYDYVSLPREVDLSDPTHADEWYSTVSYELPSGQVIRGGPIGYASTVRDSSDAARAVFAAHTTGNYLADAGFVLRDSFPRYEGEVPEAVRRATETASDENGSDESGAAPSLSKAVSELTLLV